MMRNHPSTSRRRLLAALAASAFAPRSLLAQGFSKQVFVGGVPIALPIPDKFIEPSGSSAGNEYVFDRVAPTHRTLASFVPVASAFDPSDPATWPTRYFSASTLKAREGALVPPKFFAELRGFMKTDYQKLLEEQNRAIEQAAQTGVDLLASTGVGGARQVRLLGVRVHEVIEEAESSISFLLLVRWREVENGQERVIERPQGQALVFVKGKVLYLNVHAENAAEETLAWVRSQVTSWAKLIERLN